MNSNIVKKDIIKFSLQKRDTILTHNVEHTGYGAIISRLMTGFNLSLAFNSNYHFLIKSNYKIEELFDIKVKSHKSPYQKTIVWDFIDHTWRQHPRIRAEHQFPTLKVEVNQVLNRHQWCSVIASIIIGTPTPILSKAIHDAKKKMGWDNSKMIIGLHVREGDKNTENPYIPIEIYVQIINTIINKKQNSDFKIFLATDSDLAYQKLLNYFDRLNIIYDFEEKRYNNCNAQMVLTEPELQEQESFTCAKNISLLGECDYVVGMSTAQFTWLGGLLATYNANLDTSRHIMINPFTQDIGHWANSYGFYGDEF